MNKDKVDEIFGRMSELSNSTIETMNSFKTMFEGYINILAPMIYNIEAGDIFTFRDKRGFFNHDIEGEELKGYFYATDGTQTELSYLDYKELQRIE